MSESEFIELCEAKLKDWDNESFVPFPLAGENAKAYCLGRKDILQWVLEMMPLGKSS